MVASRAIIVTRPSDLGEDMWRQLGRKTRHPPRSYGGVVDGTYWSRGRQGAQESWRRLRALRAVPPIDDHRRRGLFSAALEQAEQQFKAARLVGVESAPLNLFYGLSQAGRALAAVLSEQGAEFRLSGHGIRLHGLGQAALVDAVGTFPGLCVQGIPGASGSFTRLSLLLDSDPLVRPVPLQQLWALVLEAQLSLDPPVGLGGSDGECSCDKG